jgi:hypothetical protein
VTIPTPTIINVRRSSMRAAESKAQRRAIVENLVVCLFAIVFLCGLCGCSIVSNLRPEECPREELSASYDQTALKTSSTLDVLGKIQSLEHELLSQSDVIVASSGQNKNGYRTWFTMVTFDEYTMVAKRKYFFLVDERAKVSPTKLKRFLAAPKQGLVFDTQVVLETEVLDKPYATEEARQIAILRQVAGSLRKDIDELSGDTDGPSQGSETLTISGLLMNQLFETVLLELDKSPVLAQRLSSSSGVEFNHISFDRGSIRMVVEDDTVTVTIGLGLFM